MVASHEGAQREADPSGVSLVSFSASSSVDDAVVPETVINDDFAQRFQAHELDYVKVLAQFRRADELDVEATYYRHRAIQEEQARGLGYYAGLLRALATDRVMTAQRLRTGSVPGAGGPRVHQHRGA
jgi:hypothetical protein